ncbi:MAG: hypothetical protein IPO41_08960 [Acidobacteria bacterium]|nr:hypothetical protein [Acidobacteriota bacterium]MBP7474838.1 hypothetical protein [Pyrinomonadaceae bacterium]MBP9108258.1 hypothetical protein [Pyrinomonadaceae bacterium]
MFKLRTLAFLSILLIPALNLSAQFQTASAVSGPLQIMPVSEVKEGMRGTAQTVFSGAKSEEFKVEILGVVPNYIGPKQDMIIGRLSGANAERTFVFAGMSGSPVYINGKLVGAISYSFPFAKEPICGITPFEQMTSAVEQGPTKRLASANSRTFSYADLIADKWLPTVATVPSGSLASGFSSNSRLMAVAGQTFTPIATPLTFSGVSQKTLDAYEPLLRQAGLLAVSASTSGSAITPMKAADATTLLGGDSVVVSLSRGDVQVAAAGTVTHRDGNKIYAFGHPFFSLGSANLPMSESHVVTVVPNANNSFKLSVPDALVGTMTQDRATGIYGVLGETPKMLPVKISLTTSRGRIEEVNFESAFDELLTPLIVNVGMGNAFGASERTLGDTTVTVSGEIKVKGEQSVRIERRFAGTQSSAMAGASVAAQLQALLRADFPGADLTGVTLNMTAVDGSKTAVVDRVTLDRSQARAGDTVELSVSQRTASGMLLTQKVPFTIPKDAAPGSLAITVGDGTAVSQNSAITQFTARSAAELITTLNQLKRPDRLYAVISRTSTGAVIGSSELPNLPPSILATIHNDRTVGGSKPTVNSIVADLEIPATEYIVTGSQTISIEIVR